MSELFNNIIHFNNCFNCEYSRIDCGHISCIKDNIANWVNCPYKCDKLNNNIQEDSIND